jgi:hypothetical protein
MPGQIAYTTFHLGIDEQEVMLEDARADRTYAIQAVCYPRRGSAAPVTYEVQTEDDKFLTGGSIRCDGSAQRETVLVGISGTVVVVLTGPLDDVGGIFAALVPA